MDIYWYCPFPYPHVPPLACSVPLPDDRLFAHLPDGGIDGLVTSSPAGCTVLAELPNVERRQEWTATWGLSRTAVYLRRARLRRRRATSRHFDVAHLHFLNYFTDAWSLGGLRRRVPLVSNVHDVIPHQRRLPPFVERRTLGRLYRTAGTLVVAHELLRGLLFDEFGVDPSSVEVIPLPIPAVADSGAPVEGSSRPLVLFFGTLRRNKGVDVLLRAVRVLRANGGADVRVVIAGSGAPEVEDAVREAARRDPGIDAEIGLVSEARKEQLYREATLVVLPYTAFTSQSGVLGDAYAYGVPVVVTDVGAMGQTVHTDESGWVVPPADAEALADAIAAAVSSSSARDHAVRAARKASGSRSYAEIGRRYRELYERVAGGFG